MEWKGRVLSPQGAFMVFPCIGSLTQHTISPALRTPLIRCGSFALVFSAPILVITVILPGLFWGFKISISLISSFGSILSLTCNIVPFYFINHYTIYQDTYQNTKHKNEWFCMHVHVHKMKVQLFLEETCMSKVTLIPRGLAIPLRNSTWAPSSCLVRSPTQSIWAEQS